MKRPKGLKLYDALLTEAEVDEILARPEMVQPTPEQPQLFRLFGFFSGKTAEAPSEWMIEWGQRLQERGLFRELPNQYRLCDWIGELSDQFKWHKDNDRHGPRILSISLTDARRIGLRDPNRPRDIYEIALNRGDAYLLSGTARWALEHRILPTGQDRGGGRSFIVSYRTGEQT